MYYPTIFLYITLGLSLLLILIEIFLISNVIKNKNIKKYYFIISSFLLSFSVTSFFFNSIGLLFLPFLLVLSYFFYIVKFRSFYILIFLSLGLFLIPLFSTNIHTGNWPINLKNSNVSYKILIIVDELDAIESRKFLNQLIIKPLSYYELDRSTFNTADSFIKLFFPNSNLKQISPCGYKTLCDNDFYFRFDSIFNKKISDIKFYSGFYFPGCKNSDNEICVLKPLIKSPINSLQCFIYRKSGIFFMNSCKGKYEYFVELTNQSLIDLRKFISQYDSGYIVLHVPISHPPGPTFNISDDLKLYNKNTLFFINNVLTLLRNKKFELDIISDHPFRTEIWCNSNFYRADELNCSRIARDYGKKTPFISWSQ